MIISEVAERSSGEEKEDSLGVGETTIIKGLGVTRLISRKRTENLEIGILIKINMKQKRMMKTLRAIIKRRDYGIMSKPIMKTRMSLN